MYPFADLPANLTAFCGLLRREHGFLVGPGETRDAARVLEVVGIADERRVRDALRATLASRRADAIAFDEAFTAFFFPGPAGAPQSQAPLDRSIPPADSRAESGAWQPRDHDSPPGPDDTTGPPPDETMVPLVEDEETTERPVGRLTRARYSPLEAEGRTVVAMAPVDAAWRDAARALVRRMQLGPSRRWRAGRRGTRFDLRRTWRASLQTGGEALSPRWLHRPRRSPRFVVLIDSSRSMHGTEPAALALAVALAAVCARTEAFAFSTGLTRITPAVRRAAGGRTATSNLRRDAWGGGTNIGASLSTFLHRHAERLLGRNTVVVIVSDGLDVGDTVTLTSAMHALRRRSAVVVWVNPLIGTPGYSPTSRGMVAARPFVDTFADVRDARDLVRLARALRVR